MKPLTRRVTAVYRTASAEHIAAGEIWYAEAHAIARAQADQYQLTVETTSGILAALSPRLGWGPNVMLAERLLSHGGTLDGGCLTRSREHAAAIYAGAAPLEVLRGPKTRAFYQAILTEGTSTDAVIDRHAWDMLVGQRGATAPTAKQYREGAARMHRAAEILGQSVHHVQAATWLSWRARFWSPTAFAISTQNQEAAAW